MATTKSAPAPAGTFLAAVDSFEKSTLFTDNFKDRDEFLRKYKSGDEVAHRAFRDHCLSLKMDVPAFDGGIEIPAELAPDIVKHEVEPTRKAKLA